MPIIGAYVITFEETGKFYVGSTSDINKRISQHFSNLKHNRHVNVFLQQSWYPNCSIKVTKIVTDTREEAFDIEQEIIEINIHNPLLLNIGLHVVGGDNLTRHPDRSDIIERSRQTSIKQRSELSPELRKMIWGKFGPKNGMYGKRHTVEAKLKQSLQAKGNTTWLGKKHNECAKKKMSMCAQQRVGEKNSFYGKTHSEQTRRRLSELNKGNIPTNSRRVEIDNVIYDSATEAARRLNVAPATVLFRIKSSNVKFQGYRYITASSTTIETASSEDKGVE